VTDEEPEETLSIEENPEVAKETRGKHQEDSSLSCSGLQKTAESTNKK